MSTEREIADYVCGSEHIGDEIGRAMDDLAEAAANLSHPDIVAKVLMRARQTLTDVLPYAEKKSAEVQRLTEALAEKDRAADKEEASHLDTIAQRDAAEEALSDAFIAVTGQNPDWSSLFGYREALDEIDGALKAERGRTLEDAAEVAKGIADRIVAGLHGSSGIMRARADTARQIEIAVRALHPSKTPAEPAIPPEPEWVGDMRLYSAPNWDAEGAEPILPATIARAQKQTGLLTAPEVCPGADGTISFEFSLLDQHELWIDIGPDTFEAKIVQRSAALLPPEPAKEQG